MKFEDILKGRIVKIKDELIKSTEHTKVLSGHLRESQAILESYLKHLETMEKENGCVDGESQEENS